jgi:hypothetical protein
VRDVLGGAVAVVEGALSAGAPLVGDLGHLPSDGRGRAVRLVVVVVEGRVRRSPLVHVVLHHGNGGELLRVGLGRRDLRVSSGVPLTVLLVLAVPLFLKGIRQAVEVLVAALVLIERLRAKNYIAINYEI